MDKEHTIWKGSPSQWTNLGFYLCCIPLILIFGLGLLMALWKYLDTIYHHILITDQRIIIKRGIFSKLTKELEIYRVKDIQHSEPFYLRIMGLSNIVLYTTDLDNAIEYIKGVNNGNEIKEKLRIAIEIRRDLKQVREIDVN